MRHCSKARHYKLRCFFTRPVFKTVLSCVLLPVAWIKTAAQTPGGVSTNLSAWFKANTLVTGNVLPDNNQGTAVREWKSELGNLSVTQTTTSKMPLFMASYNTGNNFNFNPSLQFAASQIKGLVNTSTTPDLLNNNGTYFLVLNTFRETGITSSTCFSYISPSTSARYQAKADFRIQTGVVSSMGYIADLNPAATSLNPAGIPAITYPRESATMLTARSAGAAFRARRNADTTILGSDPIYYPAVGSGLGIGFSAPGFGEASSSAIAEVITYNGALTDGDINRIETYLAIKYGITLSQSNTFTLPVGPSNYTLSDGTIAWDAAANTGYGHCIAGVGRDDGSALEQKQSKSVHDSALVYIYNGATGGAFPSMNKDNIGSFTADKSALLAGDNGLDRNMAVCIFSGTMVRMNRLWKVQKTGIINTVTIAVNTSDVNASVKNLLVSNDPLFPAGATTVYPLQQANGKLYAELPFNSADYFSFASDPINVQLSATQPSCAAPNGGGVTTVITGGVTPYSYSWNTTPVQTGSAATGLSGGNYILTVASSGGCASTYPVTLVTPPFPVINVSAPVNAICPGASVSLSAAVVSGSVSSYTWKPDGQTGAGITVSPAATTAYSVIGDNGTGCTDTAFITITVKPLPSSSFTVSPSAVCVGSAQTLTYTGGNSASATYDWNNFSGAAVQTGSGNGPYSIAFGSPGNYNLQLQVTENGCPSSITTVPVTVSAAPTAAIQLSKSNFCAGDTVTVSFSGTASTTATASWTWGLGKVQSGSGLGPYKVKYTNSDNIKLTIKDGACSASTSLPVTVIRKPQAIFTQDATAGCIPLKVHFINESQDADAYQWSFGNNNGSTATNPDNTYVNPGSYDVVLIASAQGKCYDTATKTGLITTGTPPVAAFSSVPDINTPVELRQAIFVFTNLSQNAGSYLWDFGDGGSSVAANPTCQYRKTGNYTVTLYATNNGCTDSSSRKFYTVIPDKQLDIPNAFSPNGDGINDRWEIKTLSGYPDCRVEVYNRWGQTVFKSNSYPSPWDGNYNKQPLPVGIYYYIIIPSPGARPYSGWVMLTK